MGIRAGKVWKTGNGGGATPSIFLEPDADDVPVGGDICVSVSGKPGFMDTTADAAAAAARTIMAICVDGRSEIAILNSQMYRAATGTVPGRVHVGQNRARVPNTTAGTKPFVPIRSGDSWVMDKVTGTTIAVGSSYGITRVAAGNYELGVDGTGHDDAVVKVTGIYEPDYLANGSSFTKYWVQAVLPGGYI